MSHLQNCSLKIYLKNTGGRFRGVRMDVNEELKFFCENLKKKNFFFFFWGEGVRGGGVGLGGSG